MSFECIQNWTHKPRDGAIEAAVVQEALTSWSGLTQNLGRIHDERHTKCRVKLLRIGPQGKQSTERRHPAVVGAHQHFDYLKRLFIGELAEVATLGLAQSKKE